MSSYPIQASAPVSQDPQAQDNSTQASRQAGDGASHVSALPEDTVTISAEARAQQAGAAETRPGANATPNKPDPAAPANQTVSSAQEG